jgi:hypothetical protein
LNVQVKFDEESEDSLPTGKKMKNPKKTTMLIKEEDERIKW